jgi:hypothetical protein
MNFRRRISENSPLSIFPSSGARQFWCRRYKANCKFFKSTTNTLNQCNQCDHNRSPDEWEKIRVYSVSLSLSLVSIANNGQNGIWTRFLNYIFYLWFSLLNCTLTILHQNHCNITELNWMKIKVNIPDGSQQLCGFLICVQKPKSLGEMDLHKWTTHIWYCAIDYRFTLSVLFFLLLRIFQGRIISPTKKKPTRCCCCCVI